MHNKIKKTIKREGRTQKCLFLFYYMHIWCLIWYRLAGTFYEHLLLISTLSTCFERRKVVLLVYSLNPVIFIFYQNL